MLLFKKPFWGPIERGDVTLTFRRWDRARVRVGGRYRCHPIGVLEVDEVGSVAVGDIAEEDAVRAGFPTAAELVAYLAELGPLEPTTPVVRIRFHHGGDGDRVEVALDSDLSDDDVGAIRAALARMDRDRAWTAETLAAIERSPRVAASKLALELGRERLPFKADVVRLKKLGLTQSFEVGYELSPRGRAYLARSRA